MTKDHNLILRDFFYTSSCRLSFRFSSANSYSFVLNLCLVVILLVFVIHFLSIYLSACVLFDFISRTLILIHFRSFVHFRSFIHCLFLLYERYEIVFLCDLIIIIITAIIFTVSLNFLIIQVKFQCFILKFVIKGLKN